MTQRQIPPQQDQRPIDITPNRPAEPTRTDDDRSSQ